MDMISGLMLNNLPSLIGIIITIFSIYYKFKYKIEILENENNILKEQMTNAEQKLILFFQKIDKNEIFIKGFDKEFDKLDTYTKKNLDTIYNRIREIENKSKDNLLDLRKDIYKSIERKINRNKSN